MAKTVSFGAKPKPTQTNAEQWIKQRQVEAQPMKRLTIDVPANLHAQMKSQCALRNVKMADEIRGLLSKHFLEDSAQSSDKD